MTTAVRHNKPRTPPYFRAGLVGLIVLSGVLALVWLQFRGDLLPSTRLTMMATRAGLSLDPGAKVTYNGVQIGRVGDIEEVTQGGRPMAKFTLQVDPNYVQLIPANVHAEVEASTAFGNKYVALSSPENPAPQRISSSDVIDASHVTTEFNTLFETVLAIGEKIDPVKLNATLSATARALDGLGDKFGQSIISGNEIIDDLNQRMPQIHHDVRALADLADVYADASPDLWNFLQNAVNTARTFNANQHNLDVALLAAIGFGNTAGDIFERGGPYLRRGIQDLVPTSELLDYYSPELLCMIRKINQAAPKLAAAGGGNGYSIDAHVALTGASNAYVYPDNLPRTSAHGGPEGRPGCWQDITRGLWPAPYLVLDTGANAAPYNGLGVGTPWAIDYVWGRQMGENTINP
jgi:phospholipid/cholesterol/gamma-HCH transport system substrate-binding protein